MPCYNKKYYVAIRIYIPLLMLICASSILLRSPAAVSGQPDREPPLPQLSEDLSSIHARILEELSDDSLWTESSRAKELYVAIAIAGEMRYPKAADLLASHIEHPGAWFKLGSIESSFPVATALISIGMPAVDPLLHTIKSNPPRAERAAEDDNWSVERDARQVIALCVEALIQIYDHPEGMGKTICKLVLQAELKNTEDEQERDSLALAIKFVGS